MLASEKKRIGGEKHTRIADKTEEPWPEACAHLLAQTDDDNNKSETEDELFTSRTNIKDVKQTCYHTNIKQTSHQANIKQTCH